MDNKTDIEKLDVDVFLYKKKSIGFGSYGSVFKGEYKGERCAMKVLHHQAVYLLTGFYASEGEEQTVDRFLRECEALKACKHENVVEYIDTIVHPISGIIILVSELMDHDLSYYLKADEYKNVLTQQCEISISRDVACGLAYIHNLQPQPYIHRDLCGKNILLTNINEQNIPLAKISDFGLSKLFLPLRKNTTQENRPGYLPPEASHCEPDENGGFKEYDLSLDVFSCGVIMMQIALRLDNVPSRHARELCLAEFHAMKSDVYENPLKPFIVDCLEQEMDKRPSAVELYERLENRLKYSLTEDEDGFVHVVLNDSKQPNTAHGDETQEINNSGEQHQLCSLPSIEN